MDQSDNKRTIKSINPLNGQLNREYDMMTDQEVNALVERAGQAFTGWKEVSFEKRADLFRKVAAILDRRKEELARLCSIEMGKVLNQGVGEIEVCMAIFKYYAENGAKFLADKSLPTPVGTAFISYEPIGVILSIQPWNFPFYQVSRSAAPHIMAGNTYVLKHSSNVPQCAAAMEEIFAEAGAPEGVFTNLFISGAKASGLIANEHIRGVCFTGSEAAGSAVAAEAAKVVKKTVLELGGSDPCIVLEDVDLDVAVRMAALGRIQNAGQICTSPKRIIIMESIAEQFIEKAKQIYQDLKVGDPQEMDVQLGPVVSVEARDQLLDQVNQTVQAGATLVYGGKKLNRSGAFMEPTILTDIKPGMVAYSEEVFGPVLCIYKVQDEKQAVELANDSKFGLGATVICKDEERAVNVARQIESGMVFINHITSSMPELIFGGTKNSGYGRELSEEEIKEFVNHKLIRITKPDAPY